MKEHPILMTGWSVTRILQGKKTQTRRAIKPQPDWDDEVGRAQISGPLAFPIGGLGQQCGCPIFIDGRKDGVSGIRQPFGTVGQHLWVREAMQLTDGGLVYDSDKAPISRSRIPDDMPTICRPHVTAMFMPRWASRITLEITEVRVERLQDITEKDAKAEGCSNDTDWDWKPTYNDPDSGGHPTYRRDYQEVWESINGKGSWSANPWIWAISFQVVHGGTNG